MNKSKITKIKGVKCYNIFCESHSKKYKDTYCNIYDVDRPIICFELSLVKNCPARKRFNNWSRFLRPSNYMSIVEVKDKWNKIKEKYFKGEIKNG